MRRRAALLRLLAIGLVAAAAAEAESPGKVWRIALLSAALQRSAAASPPAHPYHP